MQQRFLSQDGPQIPAIGLGAWPLGGGMGHVDEQTAISTIHAALDAGITLIDTAQGYRSSESTIGKALKNGHRERVFLATKVTGHYDEKSILAAMDNSLRNLAVEYVDLYQIHHWNPAYPIRESMAVMSRLQEVGKTRFIGVSNFNADQMDLALKTARFQTNQPSYNLFDRRIEAVDIPFCEKEGIGILAHSALAKGILAGKYSPSTRFVADDERADFPEFQGELFGRYLAAAEQLKTIAGEKGITLVQVAIAWMLRLPAISCVLVGPKNPEQVQAYLGADAVEFNKDELARIDAILAGLPPFR